MPEIEEKVKFTVQTDDVKFTTRTNGDSIIITGLNLDQGQAASFAWIINHSGTLEVKVRPEPE